MLTWLMYGTFLWWVITITFVIMVFIFVEKDQLGGAIVDIAIYLAYLQFLAGVDALGHIAQNKLWALAYIGGYFIAGILWSFIKWWLFLRKRVKEYKKIRLEWINSRSKEEYNSFKEASEDLKEGWRENGPYQRKDYIIPRAADHKATIANWIICWPVSLLWSILSDFIIEIGHKIVETLNKLYQGIVKAVYKDVREDFERDLLEQPLIERRLSKKSF